MKGRKKLESFALDEHSLMPFHILTRKIYVKMNVKDLLKSLLIHNRFMLKIFYKCDEILNKKIVISRKNAYKKKLPPYSLSIEKS